MDPADLLRRIEAASDRSSALRLLEGLAKEDLVALATRVGYSPSQARRMAKGELRELIVSWARFGREHKALRGF